MPRAGRETPSTPGSAESGDTTEGLSDAEVRTRLTRQQLRWISRQLSEADRRDGANFERLRERHLGVPASHTSVFADTMPATQPLRNRLALRRLVLDAQRFAIDLEGATPDAAPEYRPTRFGREVVDLPQSGAYLFPKDTIMRTPAIVRTYRKQPLNVLEVHAPRGGAGDAAAYRRQLFDGAYDLDNPFRNTTLVAKWSHGGLDFDVVDDFAEVRHRVVFDDAIWTTVDENVHALFSHVDTIQQAGLASNRGVLLVGPPGTGKTALCKVVASELAGSVSVVMCSAPIAQHFLRQLYEEVAHLSPALVLLEDLDLIVGNRDEGLTTIAALAEFLNVLDGLMTTHRNVVTMATTNDPRSIDKAAKRSARFDRVIDVPLPNPKARRAIIEVYTERLGLVGDVDALVKATGGCTGADIRELVTEAVLRHGSQLSVTNIASLAAEQARGRRSPQIGYRSSSATDSAN